MLLPELAPHVLTRLGNGEAIECMAVRSDDAGELRHIEQSFWRMVAIRPPEVPVADDAIDRLVQRLCETVPGV